MYVDYKNLELLKKLINRQGKIISRRKSGCTAVSQHAVTDAIKRAATWPCCRTSANKVADTLRVPSARRTLHAPP